MKRSSDDTPLFDFDGETAEVTRPAVHAAERCSPSTWNEVPQARFLSWPPAMQAAYCRDRDLDSAEHAEGEEWSQFYLRRANAYDEASRA